MKKIPKEMMDPAELAKRIRQKDERRFNTRNAMVKENELSSLKLASCGLGAGDALGFIFFRSLNLQELDLSDNPVLTFSQELNVNAT